MGLQNDQFPEPTFLERIDIFGIGIAIRFNHSPCHNTRIGGLVTVSILAIIFFQAITVIKGLFEQKEPQVIYSDDYSYQPEPFYIRPDTFNLALGLQDKKFNQFMDETLYKVKATQQKLHRVKNETSGEYDMVWSREPIKMSKCTQENFLVEGSKDYFLKIPYQLMYCFDLSEKNTVIEGEFSAQAYQAIEIEFEECVGNGCATDELKKEFLNNPTLGLFMSNNIIQITEKDKPEKAMGKNLYWLNGPGLQKYITLNLVNNYINTDFGLYGKSIKKQRVVSLSSSAEQVVPRTDKVMFRLTIVYEKNREINYYRKYLKVDEAFSSLGGMFNALLTIGFVICQPFSQLELNRKLLNSIFNISGGDDTSEQEEGNDTDKMNENNLKDNEVQIQDLAKSDIIHKKPKKFDKYLVKKNHDNNLKGRQKANSDFSKMKNTEILEQIKKNAQNQDSNNNKQDIDKQVKSFFNIQFSELQIKFKDYLFNYLSFFKYFQTKRQKLISYGTNKLYTQIDLFHMISKMIEIEKLKHLLLNENQIKLFEYLPRPELRVDEVEVEEIKKEKAKKQKHLNGQKSNSFSEEEKSTGSKIQKRVEKSSQFTLFGEEQRSQLEKAQEAQKAFNQILRQNGQRSHVDDKLIKMLDPKLMNLFMENSFDFGTKRQDEDLTDSAKLDDLSLREQYSKQPQKKSLFHNKSDLIYHQQQKSIEIEINYEQNEVIEQIIESPRNKTQYIISPRSTTNDFFYNEDSEQKKLESDLQLVKSFSNRGPNRQVSPCKLKPKQLGKIND